MIAERDLDQDRTAYLNAVVNYNKAQLQLFWAMGQPPLQAPVAARASSLAVPVLPEPQPEEVPPPRIPPRR